MTPEQRNAANAFLDVEVSINQNINQLRAAVRLLEKAEPRSEYLGKLLRIEADLESTVLNLACIRLSL